MLPEDAPARSAIELADHGADQLAELTRQMLAFAGDTQIERSQVDLPSIIRDVQALIETSISKKAACAAC